MRDEEDDVCCVCLMPTSRLTLCEHRLCSECNYQLRQNVCPMCRAELPMDGMGPHCRSTQEDDDDDDGMPMTHTHSVTRMVPERSRARGAWRFELPYSDDWGDVCRSKFRELGVSLADYLQYVIIADNQGTRVNIRTGTPRPDLFPLTFFSPELEECRPALTRAEVYRGMLTSSNDIIDCDSSPPTAGPVGIIKRLCGVFRAT